MQALLLRAPSSSWTPAVVPPLVHDVLRSPGRALERRVDAELGAQLGHDFSRVRVHTDARAAESAQAVNALAYAVGKDVVFDSGRYAPHSADGRRLLAHELAHVAQQPGDASGSEIRVGRTDDPAEREAERAGSAALVPSAVGREPTLRREPTFADTSCDDVKGNIERAWPTAKRWTSNARRRLATPTAVAGELATHFKLDPNDSAQAADLSYVQDVFRRMEEIFDLQVPSVCTPPDAADGCHLPDGRRFGAFVTDGVFRITYCIPSASAGLLGGQDLIALLVHEVAHLADPPNTDWAYRHTAVQTTYARMTRAQAILNGDSYSEFARDLILGGAPRHTPLLLGVGTGVLLSAQEPRWVITASYDVRSRSGLEVFDLVGGLHGFVSVTGGESPDWSRRGAAAGGIADIGFISRAADTQFFVDTRVGAYIYSDPKASGTSTGVSARALIGWASSGFRAGVDLRLLYDVLDRNNAALIGVELGFNP